MILWYVTLCSIVLVTSSQHYNNALDTAVGLNGLTDLQSLSQIVKSPLDLIREDLTPYFAALSNSTDDSKVCSEKLFELVEALTTKKNQTESLQCE